MYTYTNRKGTCYYLRAVPTKKGKTRYVFSRDPGPGMLDAVPPELDVHESVNGLVSLMRKTERLIRDDEVEAVRSVLAAERRLRRYATEERQDAVWVFEPLGPSPEEIARIYGIPLERGEMDPGTARYTPIFRFVLLDPAARTFHVERMCFLGGERWMGLHQAGQIAKLARAFLPHLGRESFFELL